MTKDQSLWEQLRAGQQQALATIYEQEVDALFRYGCQFTADQGLVQDCIQDLFIELWKNRATIGTTTAIRQYLLVALRRKIVRQLQQRSNRQERAEKVQAESTDREQAIDEQIVQAEEVTTQQEQIARALQLLSDRQREVLYLKYFEEIDYKQIAEMLGINYQSVRNTASAGIKALRKLLAWLLIFFVNF
ncbi:MAG: sigma-70 family RNA polymerase sigma factor [Bacteroidota bacterium]